MPKTVCDTPYRYSTPAMINIPPNAKEAAMETTEEMLKAGKEAFHSFKDMTDSFYSQVSCTDLSAIQADCTTIKKGGGRDNNMEGAVALDWRLDPFVSMSDLTLIVYDGRAGVPYHVHTLLMAYGGRKSGYIAEQINNSSRQGKSKKSNGDSGTNILRQNSSKSNTSNNNAEYKVDIYIPGSAARHMPLFLDYIYGSSNLKLTTTNAPALRYLSNRFDCRDLHREVTSRFIPQDLELNTAPHYCVLADELKDFELRDKALRIIAERMDKLNVNLLKHLSPRLMRSLVQCDRLECGNSENLSIKIAQYLRLRDGMKEEEEGNLLNNSTASRRNNAETTLGADDANEHNQHSSFTPGLSDEDFYWLTHCQHMPKISPKEGLFYFHYGSTKYPQVMNEIGSGSLKSRCLAACSDSWAMDQITCHLEGKTSSHRLNNNTASSTSSALELYDNLDLKMKVQLLESTLLGAKKVMIKKEREFGNSSEIEKDVKLSNEIMYKNVSNSSKDKSKSSNNNSNVMKVVVMGCGIAPANGIYIGNSSPSSSPSSIIYEKEAVWNQRRVTFVLYPITSGQHYIQYKLAVRQQGGSGKQTKVLYNSPTVMGGASSSSVVPEHAWEVEDEVADDDGIHPPPQFVGKIEKHRTTTTASTWNKKLTHSVP